MFTVNVAKNSKRYTHYETSLTDEAKTQGAFRERKTFFIPMGTVKYEITEQKIVDLMANQGQQNKVYANYSVSLNEFGKAVKEIFNNPQYSLLLNKFQFRTNGKLLAVFKRKSEDEPWKM